jgi:hypothetical protein
MDDKLKRFVAEHREDFEMQQPRQHLWEGIDERLQHSRKRVLWQRVAIAASLMLLVTCGTWLFLSNRYSTQLMAAAPPPAQPPIVTTEAYYNQIVQVKNAELAKYCSPQPELCATFENDLGGLSLAYNQLKKEYDRAPDNKAVLRAMLSNLEMQVQLINRQLQIMETVQQKQEAAKIIL